MTVEESNKQCAAKHNEMKKSCAQAICQKSTQKRMIKNVQYSAVEEKDNQVIKNKFSTLMCRWIKAQRLIKAQRHKTGQRRKKMVEQA